MQRPDPPHMDVSAHHVGAPQSVHAPFPADNIVEKVMKLASKLGLQWCQDCSDWHDIAGGSSATRVDSYVGMRTSDSMPGSDPIL